MTIGGNVSRPFKTTQLWIFFTVSKYSKVLRCSFFKFLSGALFNPPTSQPRLLHPPLRSMMNYSDRAEVDTLTLMEDRQTLQLTAHCFYLIKNRNDWTVWYEAQNCRDECRTSPWPLNQLVSVLRLIDPLNRETVLLLYYQPIAPQPSHPPSHVSMWCVWRDSPGSTEDGAWFCSIFIPHLQLLKKTP